MGSTVTGVSQWYVEIPKTLFTVNQFGGPKESMNYLSYGVDRTTL